MLCTPIATRNPPSNGEDMKEIKITDIELPNQITNKTRFQMYRVMFPGGGVHFPSEKKARSFINVINKDLNKKLLEVNLIFSETIRMNQQIYLFRESELTDKKINLLIAEYNQTCRRLFFKSSYSPFHPISTLHNLSVTTIEILEELLKWQKRMNNTPEVHLINNYLCKCEDIISELELLPDSCGKVFTKKLETGGTNNIQKVRMYQ